MGAVTAVHWATHTKDPVASVICHSGAILEPSNVPAAKHDCPIILNHGMDDTCFNWEERYLPMKKALVKNKYNAWFVERKSGNHHVYRSDITCLKPHFEDVFKTSVTYEPVWKVSV